MALPSLISTPLDLRTLVPGLMNVDGQWVVPIQTINDFIFKSDGMIRSELREIYGSDLTCTTPYAGVPWWEADSLGAGGAVLYYGTASSSAVSEAWTLTFLSATTFSFKGTSSGSAQGTAGSTGADSASTNSRLTIPTLAWDISTPPIAGNQYYIATYNYESTLVELSSLLAASKLMDSVYGEEVPNASSDEADRCYSKYRRLMERLTDPDGQATLEIGRATYNTSPMLLAGGIQEVDDAGNFTTDYQDDEGFDH